VIQVSEMREKELHSCSYTGSLNHRATSSLLGQSEPSFHYVRKFYKSHTKITILTKKHTRFLTHKNLDTHHARITLIDLKSHQANNQRHKNNQTWWWLSLANHTCVLHV